MAFCTGLEPSVKDVTVWKWCRITTLLETEQCEDEASGFGISISSLRLLSAATTDMVCARAQGEG